MAHQVYASPPFGRTCFWPFVFVLLPLLSTHSLLLRRPSLTRAGTALTTFGPAQLLLADAHSAAVHLSSLTPATSGTLLLSHTFPSVGFPGPAFPPRLVVRCSGLLVSRRHSLRPCVRSSLRVFVKWLSPNGVPSVLLGGCFLNSQIPHLANLVDEFYDL